jgi:hypothetical protein
MITNTGKSIIIKYLLGQAPAYASYIAAGCGAKPVEQMTLTITEKALESNVARVTIGTHNFAIGEYVTISNVDTTFDGIHQITSIGGSTISYAKTASNVASFASPTTISPTGKASRNYSNKTSLDYEMFRIPITSRGYVKEDGVSKVVLTGNIPSTDRYEITELGLYSAASNPSAPSSDSRALFLFVGNESWEYHDALAAIEIPSVLNKLDTDSGNPGAIDQANIEIASTDAICFIADSSNSTFESELRLARQERTRNLGPSIYLRGDSSNLIKAATVNNVDYTTTTATYTTAEVNGILVGDTVTVSGLSPSGYNGTFTVTAIDSGSKTFTVANTTNATVTDEAGSVTLSRFAVASGAHIHTARDVSLTLDQNSPTDEMRCVFSVVSVEPGSNGESIDEIGSVRLTIRFASNHEYGGVATAFAQMDMEVSGADVDFSENRYFSISEQLQDLSRYSSFTWAAVDVVSVYASVLDPSGTPMDGYYVALDGLRIENVSTNNPLYGLVGYSVVQNQVTGTSGTYPKPIVKLPNTSNFVEFRYSVDVI